MQEQVHDAEAMASELGNFYTRLPGERDLWMVGGKPIPHETKIGLLYKFEPPEGREGYSEFLKEKTWEEFYSDVDDVLQSVSFSKEEMSKLTDQLFRKENTERFYRAYQMLRAKGYTKYDLTI